MNLFHSWFGSHKGNAPSGALPSDRPKTTGQTAVPIIPREPIPLYAEDIGLTVLWSAKAGCTFAVKWFFLHAGVLKSALAHPPNGWPHDYRNAVFCRRAGYLRGLPRAFGPDMRVIKFVRDPFERCVSAYLAYCQAAQTDQRSEHQGVLGGIRAHVSRQITPEETFTFREFVSFLGTLDLDTCDMHLARQVSTWEKAEIANAVEIVPIEISAHVLPFIERRLGLKPADASIMRDSGHHTVREADSPYCGDRPFTRTTGLKCPPCPAFYDAEIAKKVQTLYSEDFSRYGYSPERLAYVGAA